MGMTGDEYGAPIPQSVFEFAFGLEIAIFAAIILTIGGILGVEKALTMDSAPWWGWAQAIGLLGFGLMELTSIAVHRRTA